MRDGARYIVASAQRQVKGLYTDRAFLGTINKWNQVRKRVALEKKRRFELSVRDA